jgi:glycosyltransferase involved in cell wall biosynthesis
MITVHSVLQAIKGIDDQVEIILVDNSEDDKNQEVLRRIIYREYIWEGIVRIIKHPHQCLFTAREEGIREAKGQLIMFLDSHMLLGKGSLNAFLNFFSQRSEYVGIAYGPLCYSKHSTENSWHDRNPDTLSGLVLTNPETQQIAFRGVPMMFRKELWKSIKGYGSLSQHRLSWGGGDTHIGMKPLLLGYENWLVGKGTVIHLGPFHKSDRYFRPSFMHSTDSSKKHLGMIVSAYVIGGEEFALKRIAQITRRINANVTERDLHTAMQIGSDERRWILANAKYTYNDICKLYKRSKGECRTIQSKGIPTKVKKKPNRHNHLPHEHWRRRLERVQANR